MILNVDLSTRLQAHYARLKTRISELDQRLVLRYGDRYHKIKHQFGGAKDWYETTKSEAQRTNTIPLEERQEKALGEFGKTGAATARKEGVVKNRLKELWHTITNT